jgi:hypothetical protein
MYRRRTVILGIEFDQQAADEGGGTAFAELEALTSCQHTHTQREKSVLKFMLTCTLRRCFYLFVPRCTALHKILLYLLLDVCNDGVVRGG